MKVGSWISVYKLLFVFIFILFGKVNAQTWSPFTFENIHLYVEKDAPLPRNVLGIAFRSADTITNEIHFNGYLQPYYYDNTSILQNACGYPNTGGWTKYGSSWFGSKVIQANNQIRIPQHSLDTFTFHFTSQVGDTLWLLNDTLKIYGVCNSVALENILGIQDSVRRFVLHHTDINGQVIANSNINAEQLVLGKTLGLYSYFILFEDRTPSIIVELIGNRDMNVGRHSLLSSELYNFPVGTIFQEKCETYTNPNPNELQVITTNKVLASNLTATGLELTVERFKQTQSYDFQTSSLVWTTSNTQTINNTWANTELITKNVFEQRASRNLEQIINCGDTVFRLSNYVNLYASPCLLDSLGTLLPGSLSYDSEHFTKGRGKDTKVHTVFPQGPLSASCSLSYLQMPGCTIGNSFFVGVPEIELSDSFVLNHIQGNLYQIKTSFENIQVVRINGELLEPAYDDVYDFKPYELYFIRLVNKDQTLLRKVCIME